MDWIELGVESSSKDILPSNKETQGPGFQLKISNVYTDQVQHELEAGLFAC